MKEIEGCESERRKKREERVRERLCTSGVERCKGESEGGCRQWNLAATSAWPFVVTPSLPTWSDHTPLIRNKKDK